MTKIKIHIKTVRNFGLMWFVLFALSPCTVKDVFFSSVNSEYAKPLNKSRTTAPTISCSFAQTENQQYSVVKELKINKQTEPGAFSDLSYLTFDAVIIHNYYSKKSSGNSPPKYILYKRLKIAIA